jgi:hypothetical protein
MANANISHITLSNTFSNWRGATNDLANSINDLRNGDYVKDKGENFIINNGALFVDKQTGITLNVAANANVQNNFTTKTKIVHDQAFYHGDDARFSNTKVILEIANTLSAKYLISNTLIIGQNTIVTDLTVGGDNSGECWIQGDPYPSKTPIYVEGVFQGIDRGLNFLANSIASAVVTSNTANTKVTDVEVEISLPDDGNKGIKGQKGQKGQPGVQGVQGAQGSQGVSGRQGTQGAQGFQGFIGQTGEVIGGTKGDKGDKGEFGYGQFGDDGEKGQKGESIGATKGEKGAKGDKGILGDAGTNAAASEKGEKGDLGYTGIVGDDAIVAELVSAYANFSGGFTGFSPTISSSNNISSITISSYIQPGIRKRAYPVTVYVYRLNFGTPMTDANFSVIGSARKPNSAESTYYYLGSGHLQLIDKTTSYVEVAYGLSGNYSSGNRATRYFISQDASVIVVGSKPTS